MGVYFEYRRFSDSSFILSCKDKPFEISDFEDGDDSGLYQADQLQLTDFCRAMSASARYFLRRNTASHHTGRTRWRGQPLPDIERMPGLLAESAPPRWRDAAMAGRYIALEEFPPEPASVAFCLYAFHSPLMARRHFASHTIISRLMLNTVAEIPITVTSSAIAASHHFRTPAIDDKLVTYIADDIICHGYALSLSQLSPKFLTFQLTSSPASSRIAATSD